MGRNGESELSTRIVTEFRSRVRAVDSERVCFLTQDRVVCLLVVRCFFK
jgi:hypothetical protein